MDRGYLEMALGRLKHLQKHGPINTTTGICWNTKLDAYWFGDYTKDWPKHSGDELYPVPATNAKYKHSRKGAKKQYHNSKNLWIRAQGELRQELLQFAIDKITKELEL